MGWRGLSRSFTVAVGYKPARVCGQCTWIRDYCGRYVCFALGRVGRAVGVGEDASFCEGFEEAV
jgi:hypothetical protein